MRCGWATAAIGGRLALLAGASVGVGCGDGATGPAAPRWSAPVAIEHLTTGEARGLAIDMDDAGNAVAVWTHSNSADGVFSIEAIRFDGTTNTWNAPDTIETNDVDDTDDADLAVDDAGNAAVVWRQLSGGEDSIWSSWFDAGARTWHGAALVEIDDTGAAQKPSVAALPAGGAVAVWHQWDGLRQSLWGKRLTGAPLAWGDRSLLETTDSADALEPDVAVDRAGNAVAVWTETDGVTMRVWAAHQEPAAGTWSAPVTLGAPGVDDAANTPAPRVVLDAAGDGLAIWSLRMGLVWSIWASRYHGGTATWDAPALVEADDRGHALRPEIALDASGNAFVAWRQHDGARFEIWTNRFVKESGTWSGPVRLEAADDEARFPSVAAAGDRQAVVVWPQPSGVRASRFDPRTNTWGPPSLLDAGDPESPKVAVDAAGNALAIWTRPEGSGFDLLAATHRF